MNDLIELIKNYEKRNDVVTINVVLFSDGSGIIKDWNTELFIFDNPKELKDWLENN